jgi:hypothetical protein
MALSRSGVRAPYPPLEQALRSMRLRKAFLSSKGELANLLNDSTTLLGARYVNMVCEYGVGLSKQRFLIHFAPY